MNNAPTTIDMSHPRAALEGYGNTRCNIRAVGMFHAPESWAELNDWIERHAPEERLHLSTAAVMAWNLAARFDAHNEATEQARSDAATVDS